MSKAFIVIALPYSFAQQLEKGLSVESEILQLLEFRGWEVMRQKFIANRKTQQRLGYDAVISKPGYKFRLEIKADFKAAKTGNFFIETVSVDKDGTGGWAVTSQAQLLAIALPQRREMFMVYFSWLRSELFRWNRLYGERSCRNENDNWRGNFNSRGLLVPVKVFREEAIARSGNVRLIKY